MVRRIYNSNPKHEVSGARGVKGSRLDLTADEASVLLNDATRCFEVPGKKQLVAVKDQKIYVFQPDGAGGHHAYPSTGNEIASRYPTIANRLLQKGTDPEGECVFAGEFAVPERVSPLFQQAANRVAAMLGVDFKRLSRMN